jgi:phosphate starvation-inducible PhoH-like protein
VEKVEEKKLSLKGVDIPKFVGVQNANLQLLRSHFPGKLVFRGEELYVTGRAEEIEQLEKIVTILKEKLRRDGNLEELDVMEAVNAVKGSPISEDYVIHTPKKLIRPRTKNQLHYLKAIESNDIVIAIGPAGTGKTFLAVAMALKFLKERKVERIILTRPAVEAGESLGFLPGDFQEKIHPYLTPLYDALYAMMPPERVKHLTDRGIIEIAPLAYMRGRTLSEAFVILDEGQNTKSVQMKMFLTRLGPKSKAVLTGDITQIDLPHEETSGLVEIQQILKGIKGIAFCYFGPEDVIRHRLVKQIVEVYEKHVANREARQSN